VVEKKKKHLSWKIKDFILANAAFRLPGARHLTTVYISLNGVSLLYFYIPPPPPQSIFRTLTTISGPRLSDWMRQFMGKEKVWADKTVLVHYYETSISSINTRN
jgi:hypothetical protein